ncbi:MAG TPA: glycosyltransferase [Thermoanaerobaculia bacterium]|nr:glycosyltransferase [Thermoanaerobaculia bacterium]
MKAQPLSWVGEPSRVPPDRPPGAVDIIVPVAGAPEAFGRCVESLLAWTNLERHRLVVVLDGPQPAAVESLVSRLERERPEGLLVLRNSERLGFVASANRGMSASDRDVILLNSDTQVTEGWVRKLQEAAYSASEIATATPFSNSATICSLPRFLEHNALPAGQTVDSFARLVEARSRRAYPRLPTGVGVCLYIKRKALDQVGLFDTRSFGQGYGEESEFCMRALKAGYAHVLDDATFIFHEGQRSFGMSRGKRVEVAHRALRRLHPEYLETVAAFLREDPIRPLRQRVLAEIRPVRRPQLAGRPERVLHLVHGWPPWSPAGTELYAAWLARRQAQVREVAAYARIADPTRAKGEVMELLDAGVRVRLVVNNFTQRDPLSRNAIYDRALTADFARLLDTFNPRLLHVHHLAGHAASLVGAAARRGIPIVFQIQDWWLACARANLFDTQRRLCSGPDAGKCAACLPLTGLPPGPLLNRLLYAVRRRAMLRALRHADAFVLGGRFIHESALRLGLLRPADPAYVIPYGVEVGPPPPRRSERPAREPGAPLRFGFIGALLPHKGAHLAAAAFAGIDPSRARLIVWGDPGISPAYARELERLGGAGLELRGRFPEERKAEIFAEIDALLVPSVGLESFGLVAREAQHHGLPVLASDRGALSELFASDPSGGAGAAGALFDPDFPHALRGWIERLIADPGQLDRWAAAVQPVKTFDVHAEEIEEVYDRVLARRSAADRLERTLSGTRSGGRRRRTA